MHVTFFFQYTAVYPFFNLTNLNLMTKNVMDKEKIKIMRIACLDITIGITPGAVAHPGLLLGWGLKL